VCAKANGFHPNFTGWAADKNAQVDHDEYTDAANWYYRYFSSTAAQNTPDASGLQRFVDNRKRSIASVVQVWGDPAYTRTDTYYDGSAWSVCPTSFENTNTVRDAQGRSESFYCGAYHGSSVRSVVDVAGQTMSDVVTQIRAYPLTNSAGSYPLWGPDPALLGTAVFPANSKLIYQTSTQISNPDAHVATTVGAYPAEVAAGGTPTFDANGVASVACGNVTAANAASLFQPIQTLDQLIALYPGKPCVFGPNASAGPRNDWWGNSSINVGTISGPAPASSYYQSNRAVRASFGSANSVTYHLCAMRASDGSPRNCEVAGTGTYSIETVSDARVLRLANPPLIATTLTYTRSFVERGGKVYFGFRDKLKVDHAVRLNADGMDALLGQLGLTR
jgi:trimeric autotransporter adhesin